MNLYLYSIYLPKLYSKEELSKLLSISLSKGIETAYYGYRDDIFVMFTQFNVLTLIDRSKENILLVLKKLEIEFLDDNIYIYQDYNISIDYNLQKEFNISNNIVIIKNISPINMNILSLVISQSVGLDKYERELNRLLLQSNEILQSNYSIFNRKKLIKFVKYLTLIRHEILSSMFFLDKPNILWDNENMEMFYNSLASLYELKDRFNVVEYKLNQIKDDVILVMDFINHKQSEFLEWIIIILILIEIVMNLVE